jgi:predicted ATPase
MTSFWMGELALAHSHFEQSFAYYDPAKHRDLSNLIGMHPAVGLSGYASLPLWMLGYPDQSLQRTQRALAIAKELGHSSSSAMAFSHAAGSYNLRGDAQSARRLAEAGLALSNEQGFALWAAICTLALGGALIQSGQVTKGLSISEEGMRAYRARGSEVGLPEQLGFEAEAHGKLGQTVEGLTQIAQAIATAHENVELSHEPELHRLKGELLLMHDASNTAEAE